MSRIAIASLTVLLCACTAGGPASPEAGAATPAPPEPAAEPGERPATPATDRYLVLPGDYAQSTTLQDLRDRFGAANVAIDESPGPDGEPGRRVVLFPDDPSRRAVVEFYDTQALEGIASIVVSDAGSRWRGKEGVRVGMSLADVRRANGWRFNYLGFDSEGRAWAHDQWSPSEGDENTLGRLDVGEDDHMYFGVELRLRGAPGEVPADAYPHDDYASSDDPRWPRIGEQAEVAALVASTSLDDEWE